MSRRLQLRFRMSESAVIVYATSTTSATLACRMPANRGSAYAPLDMAGKRSGMRFADPNENKSAIT